MAAKHQEDTEEDAEAPEPVAPSESGRGSQVPQPESAAPGAHAETAPEWLTRVLAEARLSLREASAIVRREESYFWQLLVKRRKRTLPTPQELELLVPHLRGVTLIEALEKVWGLDRAMIVESVAVLAARNEAGVRWEDLNADQRENIKQTIYIALGNAAMRARAKGNGGDD